LKKIQNQTVKLNPSLIIRGLEPHVNDILLADYCRSFGEVQEVTVVTDKMNGNSKGYGFIHFKSTDASSYFMNYTNGQLKVENNICTLEYCKDKPKFNQEDWVCSRCRGQNYARRLVCYQCNTPKPENAEKCIPSDQQEKNKGATTILVIKGLSPFTTQDTVQRVFAPYGDVIRCNLIREKATNESKGFCFVEYSNLDDSIRAYKATLGLHIEGSPVRVKYANGKDEPHVYVFADKQLGAFF